jgi:tetratricopeptide (TPR) repeat protein
MANEGQTLRLTVRRGKKEEKKENRTQSPQAAPEVSSEAGSSETHQQQQHQQQEEDSRQQSMDEVPELVENHEQSCPQAEAILRLISRLFNCQAEIEMVKQHSSVDFKGLLKQVRLGEEVHVDVDQDVLRHMTIETSNKEMDKHNYDAAAAILKIAADVFPTSKVIPYNLACAFSLMNDSQQAVNFFLKALERGYNDVEQIDNDRDLDNIRQCPEFITAVDRLRPVQQQQQQPEEPQQEEEEVQQQESTSSSSSSSSAPVPSAPQLRYPTEVETLIAIFPDVTPEVADSMLVAQNGNLRAVVNSFLQ